MLNPFDKNPNSNFNQGCLLESKLSADTIFISFAGLSQDATLRNLSIEAIIHCIDNSEDKENITEKVYDLTCQEIDKLLNNPNYVNFQSQTSKMDPLSGYLSLLGKLISTEFLSQDIQKVRFTSNLLLNHLNKSENSIEACCYSLSLVSRLSICGEIVHSKLINNILEPTLRHRSSVQLNNLVEISKLLYSLINDYGPEICNQNHLLDQVKKCLNTIDCYQNEEDLVMLSIKCKQALHLFIHKDEKFSQNLIKTCVLALLNKNKSNKFITCLTTCLRQLAQRDAKMLSKLGGYYLQKYANFDELEIGSSSGLHNLFGLEGYLVYTSDLYQIDTIDISEILMISVNANYSSQLEFWIKLCLFILSGNKKEETKNISELKDATLEDEPELDDDEGQFTDGSSKGKNAKEKKCRWAVRLTVIKLVLKIFELCQNDKNKNFHFNLKATMEEKKAIKLGTSKLNETDFQVSNFLAIHLPDLVKLTFMAATDENHTVRLLGLNALEQLILLFKDAKEPEFDTLYLLEQYQAQVAAALSPAFGKLIDREKLSMHDNSPPPHVVSTACKVASTWLSSGVCSSLNDTQRVYRLLVGSLDRIRYEKQFISQGFSEIARLKQVLAVLKAWGLIYMVSLNHGKANNKVSNSLAELISPELNSLKSLWSDILRIVLISEKSEEISFYTMKSSLLSNLFKNVNKEDNQMIKLLNNSWPTISMAYAAITASANQHQEGEPQDDATDGSLDKKIIYISVMKFLSHIKSKSSFENVKSCLIALKYWAVFD